jgi:hypothetical protein
VLERVRTQELLARFLPPPPATVLDVGGGRSLRVIQSAADRSQQKVSVMFRFYRRHRRIRQAARSSFFGNQRNADHRRQRRVP